MRLVIKVDQDRIAELITVNEYVGVTNRDMRAMIALVTKCLWNEDAGVFYEVDEARKLVGKLTLKQLGELVNAVTNEMQQVAVPNESEDAYEQG